MDTATLPAPPSVNPKRAAAVARLMASMGQGAGLPHAYQAASTRDANIGSWRPSLRSVDAEIFRDAATVRARARALVRDNPTARQAVRISRQGTVGAYLRLVLKPDYEFLGLDHEVAAQWARMAERVWENYAHGIACWIDAGRRFSFTELMNLVHDSDFTDGETLVATEWDKSRPWNTCFQVVDVDRLSNPSGQPDTVAFKGGVELSSFGAPVAYHIRQSHPGDIGLIGATPWIWDRVLRETPWYRPIMMHTFDPARAGQTRGISEFASVIHALKLGHEYAQAELANATVRAGFVAVLTSALNFKDAATFLAEGRDPTQADTEGEMLAEMALANLEATAGYYNELNLNVNGQKIPKLSPGDDLKFLGNNTPGTGYADFIRSQVLNVAAGLGVDPTGISQDYKGVNYSSGKMSAANNGRGYETRRARLIRMVAMPMCAAFMEEAILSGRLPMPKGLSVNDFWDARDALVKGTFITAGPPSLEPLKDAQATQLRLQMNMTTLVDEMAAEGKALDEELEQRAREIEKLTAAGLMPTGAAPPPEPAQDAPENQQKTDGGV